MAGWAAAVSSWIAAVCMMFCVWFTSASMDSIKGQAGSSHGLWSLIDLHLQVKLNAWEAPTSISKWKEEHVSAAQHHCMSSLLQSLTAC